MRSHLISCCLLATMASASVVKADTIVDVTSGSNCCGSAANATSALQMSFTTSQEFRDVTIALPWFSFVNDVPFHINAFFTTASGPGTIPPPLDSSSFSDLIARRSNPQ
jgi:hypothetical protein